MANIPQNCRECEHNMTCDNTYYGGSLCKHEKEINEIALERFWAQFDKPQDNKQ